MTDDRDKQWMKEGVSFPGYKNAYLQIVKKDGSERVSIPFAISPSNFNDTRSNLFQTVRTMSGWVVLKLGTEPIAVTISGYMLDCAEKQERHEFLEKYKQYIEDNKNYNHYYYNDYNCTLIIEGREYIGYVSSLTYTKSAERPFLYQYTIQFVALGENKYDSGSDTQVQVNSDYNLTLNEIAASGKVSPSVNNELSASSSNSSQQTATSSSTDYTAPLTQDEEVARFNSVKATLQELNTYGYETSRMESIPYQAVNYHIYNTLDDKYYNVEGAKQRPMYSAEYYAQIDRDKEYQSQEAAKQEQFNMQVEKSPYPSNIIGVTQLITVQIQSIINFDNDIPAIYNQPELNQRKEKVATLQRYMDNLNSFFQYRIAQAEKTTKTPMDVKVKNLHDRSFVAIDKATSLIHDESTNPVYFKDNEDYRMIQIRTFFGMIANQIIKIGTK